MTNKPLRYRISQWEQAVKCKSNMSEKYSIHVSTVEYMPEIYGKLIQVEHEHVGIVFSVMLDPKGSRVEQSALLHPMPTEIILEYLKCFGFYIEYKPEAVLPEMQKQYLQELQALCMDKIRIMFIFYRDENGEKVIKPVLTAFSSSILSDWLLNNYTCSRDEFNARCGEGLAIRIDARDFDWSWLTYVANISDILNNK